MITLGLTKSPSAARTAFMQSIGQGTGRSAGRISYATVLILMAVPMLSGCVSVTAPDKPIVIELNINIKQDVVYSLAPDAKNTIESNSGIF